VEKDTVRVEGRNHLHLMPIAGSGSAAGTIVNRIYKIGKHRMADRVMKEGRIDLIVACDGITEGLIGLRLSRKYNVPFVFYLSSLFHLLDRDAFELEKDPRNFLKYIESFLAEHLYVHLIKRSSVFHPISEAMGAYYSRYNKESIPLPLCAGRPFLEASKKPPRKTGDDFQILITGSFGPTRRILDILDILKQVKLSKPGKRKTMRMVGKMNGGEYKLSFLERIEEM